MNDELQIKLYNELLPYARYLAMPFQSGDILVSQEDVVAELLVELVKCFNRYHTKPYLDMLKMTKRTMFYRTKELRYRYYVTSRKESIKNIDLDADWLVGVNASEDAPGLHESISDDEESHEAHQEGIEFWDELLRRVSSTTASVAKLLLDPTERLMEILQLSTIRADFAYKGGCKKIAVNTFHVADALLLDEEQVIYSYEELANVIQEMYNEGY